MSAYADAFNFDPPPENPEPEANDREQIPFYVKKIFYDPVSPTPPSKNRLKKGKPQSASNADTGFSRFFNKLFSDSSEDEDNNKGKLRAAKTRVVPSFCDISFQFEAELNGRKCSVKRTLSSLVSMRQTLLDENILVDEIYKDNEIDALNCSRTLLSEKLKIHELSINRFVYYCLTSSAISSSNTFLKYVWAPLRGESRSARDKTKPRKRGWDQD